MATYHAHIVTGEAVALGDPGIVIVADDGDPGGTVVETLALPLAADYTEVLDDHGWCVGPEAPADQQPDIGCTVCEVTPVRWLDIVGRVTAHRGAAQAEAERADAGWRRVVADAVRDRARGVAVQAIADSAGIHRSRAYQIVDETPGPIDVRALLIDTGADPDRITHRTDDLYEVRRADGSRVVIGEAEGGGWWDFTDYSSEDEPQRTDGAATLSAALALVGDLG